MARKKTKKRPVIARDDVESRATLKSDDETEDYDDADSSPARVPNVVDASRVAFGARASPSRVRGEDEGPVKLCVTVRPQVVVAFVRRCGTARKKALAASALLR